MMVKMNERGIKTESMIWAWYQWLNGEKKPDLVSGFHAAPGLSKCCLEFEAPDNLVLLSCFGGCDCVLNIGICH